MAYREFAVPTSLARTVVCTWEHRAEGDVSQLVVPDASVDLIWLAGRELVVAGPDTRPHLEELPAGSVTTGIRLTTAAAGSFLGRPAGDLVDARVAAAEVWRRWPAAVEDALADVSPHRARELLTDAVRDRAVAADPLVARASRLLDAPGRRVAGVAEELGVSERQLHRRCRAAIGYGPKFLARVLRLQTLVRTRGGLADRALAAGYVSQSHMSEDVRRLTGLTAVRFLKDRGP